MALCGSSLVGKGTAQATSNRECDDQRSCVIAFNGPPSSG
jgi:hypothetical protein